MPELRRKTRCVTEPVIGRCKRGVPKPVPSKMADLSTSSGSFKSKSEIQHCLISTLRNDKAIQIADESDLALMGNSAMCFLVSDNVTITVTIDSNHYYWLMSPYCCN